MTETVALDDKLFKLAILFEDSELIRAVEKHFDEETAEKMIIEFKREIINLLDE